MRRPTRRPTKKKAARKKAMAANNRQLKQLRRKKQRKLKTKLLKIIDKIGMGYYDGVKDSPLMKANWNFVQRVLKQKLQMRRMQ
jgi:hypothetical protein